MKKIIVFIFCSLISLSSFAQMTIAEAIATNLNSNVSITGIVTFVRGKNVYLQDDTGGVLVYSSTYTACQIGDSVYVTGKNVIHGGAPEINNANILVLQSNKTLPAEIKISLDSLLTNPLKYFAMRVCVESLRIASYGDRGDISVTDGVNTVLCYYVCPDSTEFRVGSVINIHLIASYFNGFEFVGPNDGMELLGVEVQCGDNLIAVFDRDSAILTISGTGPMWGLDRFTWPFNLNSVDSVYIEDGVMSFGGRVFCNFGSLHSIVIPNSVTSIDSYAFSACSSLLAITLPDSLKRIGAYTFALCNNLVSINIPDSITIIEEGTFYHCDSLNAITLPNNLKGIGDSAFSYCEKISSINIPESVASIGDNAFSGCTSLDSIVWNARYIADSTLSPFNDSHGNVKMFVFGDSVRHIPAYICSNMTRIKEITIPANIESIGENAFIGCDSLGKVDVYNLAVWCNTDFTNTYCPLRTADLYVNGVKPTRIDIPDGVTNVGAYTFMNCKQVTEVTLPSSVTELGEGAFAGDSYLQTITLDNALVTIGDSAFASCPYLLTINANMEFPPVINTSVFANCGLLSGIDCYVPQGSLALYRKTLVWADFNLHGTATNLQSKQVINNFTQTQKFFEDGKMYILLPDGTKYSATGKKVE